MSPSQFHAAGWHGDLHVPVVDDKYIDPTTGELKSMADYTREHGPPCFYSGPPCVDVIIQSLHIDTVGSMYRSGQPYPMGALLAAMMKVVAERQVGLDSVTATPYAIRVILRHELTKEEFKEVAVKMANALSDEK